MPYSPLLVKPMRDELTHAGLEELVTAEQVDTFLATRSGTLFLVVNSVCGCAAGTARPAVRLALAHARVPDRKGSVFAGQDIEATAQARSYFADIPPSSPSMALFKDGELVYFLPKHRIEARAPDQLAAELTAAFDEFCTPPAK